MKGGCSLRSIAIFMKDGFLKVAAITPNIKVADVDFNVNSIISHINQAFREEVKLCVFPELCITSYTCQDLFNQRLLIEKALEGLERIVKSTEGKEIICTVGCPLLNNGKLYNCGVVIYNGDILGVVPKTSLPNYNEFYEIRHFSSAPKDTEQIELFGKSYPFGSKILFKAKEMKELIYAVEICEDLWSPCPISNQHALAGATLIGNLSASDEVIGKDKYRRELVNNQSARLICGYVYCSAGEGESTQDMVFSGHNIISENGAILKESRLFENEMTISEIDLQKLAGERKKLSTFPESNDSGYVTVEFSMKPKDTSLTRFYSKTPFIPYDEFEKNSRCELILRMQSEGLKKRISHTNAKSIVIGISGGLDSALALLVCVNAIDLLDRSREDIVAVTMPCFGTTKRTRSNAEILCNTLGVTFREVDITSSVLQHFEDIGHNQSNHDVVFENGQARERTQVLMNIANQVGGFVVGTGDLSELALGWATYNGDHMSMYGVNASVPKTLVRHIIKYYADTCGDDEVKKVLYDIFDTPVSPELLPTDESKENITQKTEDIVGPYELHDFFLYYAIRWGFPPRKVLRLAKYAFDGKYDNITILKWLEKFYSRFFSQQFKRSCLPDGAKIGTVTLSPRGDWRMPSDAVSKLWIDELEQDKKNDMPFLYFTK